MPFRRETIPSMLRRRNGWNYKGLGRYIVTLTMLDRTRDWLGRLVRRAELGLAGEPSGTGNARPLTSGAADCNYRGIKPTNVDALALAAAELR